jgi:serine/threonine protein kinase
MTPSDPPIPAPPRRAPAPLQPGDPATLGPYRVMGRLGQGGMGTVYLAVSPAGGHVAIKVIRADHLRDPAARARFHREVDAARRVARFCTARVLDADLDGRPPFVVTEYIDGPNLQEVVEGRGPLGSSGLDTLAVGVLTALAAIHAAGVVHRDLKPANVLLSDFGPRVIDFGIAGALDFTSGLTGVGQFLGTPAYMAPEQVDGLPITPAVDVFAWGCLVTYAARGRPPFDGTNLVRLAYQIVHSQPDLNGVDDDLRPLVERALAKAPGERPSARELLHTLLRDPGGPEDLVAASDAVVSRTWSSAMTATAPASTEPAATEPAPAPFAPVEPPPRRPSGPATPPPPPRPRRRGRGRAGALLLGLVVVAAATFAVLQRDRLPGGWRGTDPTGTTVAPDATEGTALQVTEAPDVLMAAWTDAGAKTDCPPALPTDLGDDGEGAKIRRADFGPDQWAVAWDKAGLPGVRGSGEYCKDCGRGAFGIAGVELGTEQEFQRWKIKRTLANGWRAGYEGGGATTFDGADEWHGNVRVPGKNCEYTVWSYLGREHFEAMLESLTLVAV